VERRGENPNRPEVILSRLGDTRAGLASLFLHAYANQASSCSTPVCRHGGVDLFIPSVYSCALTFSARSYATHVPYIRSTPTAHVNTPRIRSVHRWIDPSPSSLGSVELASLVGVVHDAQCTHINCGYMHEYQGGNTSRPLLDCCCCSALFMPTLHCIVTGSEKRALLMRPSGRRSYRCAYVSVCVCNAYGRSIPSQCTTMLMMTSGQSK
jgi:hypothetical protein